MPFTHTPNLLVTQGKHISFQVSSGTGMATLVCGLSFKKRFLKENNSNKKKSKDSLLGKIKPLLEYPSLSKYDL